MIREIEIEEKSDFHGSAESEKAKFALLVQKYQNLVTSIAFSLTGDFQRSEDIAQKTFLLAWEKGHRQDTGYLKSWLRKTAKNLSKNDNRLMHHRSVSLNEFSTDFADISSSEDSHQRRQLLWETLNQIPENYRQVMILYYRQEKSIQQVADLLELSTDVVKQRLSRGRKMLKQEVEKWVDETLQGTETSSTFVGGVIAMIPSGGVLAQTALKTGSSVGLSSILGKVSAMLSFGSFVGMLGGVAGAGLGLWGAKLGTDNTVKHATSEEEKELAQNLFFRMAVVSILLVIAEFVVVLGLSGHSIQPILLFLTPALFSAYIICDVIYFAVQQRRLHEKHGAPDWTEEIKSQQVTPAGLAASVFGFTIGIWVWFLVLSGLAGQWNWLVIGAVLMIALIVLGATLARSCTEVNQQRVLYGRLCLLNAWIQFPLVVLFWCAFPKVDEFLEKSKMVSSINVEGIPLPTLLTGFLVFLVLNLVGLVIIKKSVK